jgi:hypothetical protein
MKRRNLVLGVAFALMILAGCGNDSDDTSAPPRTGSEVARGTATAPAAPRPESEVTVSDDHSATKRFRSDGRSWQGWEDGVQQQDGL